MSLYRQKSISVIVVYLVNDYYLKVCVLVYCELSKFYHCIRQWQ